MALQCWTMCYSARPHLGPRRGPPNLLRDLSHEVPASGTRYSLMQSCSPPLQHRTEVMRYSALQQHWRKARATNAQQDFTVKMTIYS
jgi:hypothetical protein